MKKLLSKLRSRATPQTNRWALYSVGSGVNGPDTAVLLRTVATVASPQPAKKVERAARKWSDNCSDLSRIAQDRGNVKVLTKEKCQVLAERNGWSIERAKGFVDGESCRQRGKKPSRYALVGIDEYSLGFRAGYYERRNGVSKADAPRSTDHLT